MRLFRLSPSALAKEWAQLERDAAFDFNQFDEAVEPEIERRASLLSKARIDPTTARAFSLACIPRARDYAVSALKAAGMDAGSGGTLDEALAVARWAEALRVRAEESAKEATLTLARFKERHTETLPRILDRPIEEVPIESIAQLGASMRDNVMNLVDLVPAEDRAILYGSVYGALHMTYAAAWACRDTATNSEAWEDDLAPISAAGATLAAASVPLYSTAAAYFAHPPESPMLKRATFYDFAEAGHSELEWQARWLAGERTSS